jgi:hypothetical protein
MGQYFGIGLACSWVFLAAEAQANCPQGQELFTSCQIEGRNTAVLVCSDDQVATYGYGAIGKAPDLVLSEAVRHVDFEPWSGVGKEIAESVTFYNGDYSYHVVGGFNQPFFEEETQPSSWHYGWIDVAKNGARLSRLECIPETVTYGYPSSIYDAKVGAGLIWDDRSRVWQYDPNHPAAPRIGAPVLMQEPLSKGANDCLPAAEFQLGGIMMDGPVAKLGDLGPLEVTERFMGGIHDIERFNYNGLHVDTFQGMVMGMQSTGPQWETPSGLKVGLRREEVILILGRVRTSQEETAHLFSAPVCMGDQDDFAKWYALIEFGHDWRVQSINFASVSP